MIFENSFGKSIIRLRACEERNEYALFVRQNAVAIDIPDNSGSIGRYFYSLSYTDIASELLELRRSLNTGEINSSLTIEENFRSLLELFEPGKYMLSLNAFDVSFLQVEKAPTAYYPKENILLWTQPVSEINEKRIDYYKDLIKAGKRPIAVITGMQIKFEDMLEESPDYILDGHHKMKAYLELGINPNALYINRQVDNWTEVDIEYFPVDEMLYYKTYNTLHFE